MKLYAIGGYNEVGMNMSAVEVSEEIVIFDMGYNMEELMDDDDQIEKIGTKDAIQRGIIPNDEMIYEQRDKVKAIVIGHAHLDHVGAVAKIASSYNCPIIATPYTMKIIQQQIKEERKSVGNEQVILKAGETYEINQNLSVEFVKITHSIPDTVVPVLHTPDGTFVYGLDYRLDNNPVLGKQTDMKRLEEIGDEDVKIFLGDSTRVSERGTGKSEQSVREDLKFKFDRLYQKKGAVIITTFSSHIERLKTILEINAGRRKVAFVGRSLKEYTQPAEELNLIDLSGIKLASYRDDVNGLFEEINKAREDWLIVCTGNQGEARSVLKRLADGEIPFELRPGDDVIFSSTTIPTEINRAERYKLERALKKKGASLHLDVHASGHGHREDLRLMIQLLRPEYMIPGHGDIHKLADHAKLAQEEGYVLNENLFICENGNTLEV